MSISASFAGCGSGVGTKHHRNQTFPSMTGKCRITLSGTTPGLLRTARLWKQVQDLLFFKCYHFLSVRHHYQPCMLILQVEVEGLEGSAKASPWPTAMPPHGKRFYATFPRICSRQSWPRCPGSAGRREHNTCPLPIRINRDMFLVQRGERVNIGGVSATRQVNVMKREMRV